MFTLLEMTDILQEEEGSILFPFFTKGIKVESLVQIVKTPWLDLVSPLLGARIHSTCSSVKRIDFFGSRYNMCLALPSPFSWLFEGCKGQHTALLDGAEGWSAS